MSKSSATKHYKQNNKGVSSAGKKVFLVFVYDEQKMLPEIAGSYYNQKDADSTLNHFLKSGICSWIVSRNG